MTDFNPYIIFHWGNLIIGSEIWKMKIIPWINKFRQTKIYITFHKNKYDQIRSIIDPTYIKIIDHIIIFDDYITLFQVPNIGMDIGPFFHTIKYIMNTHISDDIKLITIIKIHTKSDTTWRNLAINPLLNPNIEKSLINKWNNKKVGIYIPKAYKYKLDYLNSSTTDELLQIMNIDFDLNKSSETTTIKKIITRVKHHSEVDFDYEFYQNYNNIQCYYDNEIDIKLFLDYHWKNVGKHRNLLYNKTQLDNSNDISTNNNDIVTELITIPIVHNRPTYYFSAGTMVWIKGDVIYEFFSSFDFDRHLDLLEPGYTINDKPTYVHAWERIISLIPIFYNKIDLNDL